MMIFPIILHLTPAKMLDVIVVPKVLYESFQDLKMVTGCRRSGNNKGARAMEDIQKRYLGVKTFRCDFDAKAGRGGVA